MIIPDSSVIRSTGKRPESLPDIEPTVFGFVGDEGEIKPGGVTEGEADGETEEETEEAAVGEADGETEEETEEAAVGEADGEI